MKGLRINCPECGKALNIRTSHRPTACVTVALVYCLDCDLKGEINAELINIKRADFSPINAEHIWKQDRLIAQRQQQAKK